MLFRSEDKCQKDLGITLIDIINVYQEVIEYAGYEFGVYTGLAFYNYYIKPYANNVNCQFWIAHILFITQEHDEATKNIYFPDVYSDYYRKCLCSKGLL